MKEIFKKLIEKWICSHTWDEFRFVSVDDDWGSNWHIYHFKCLKCGKFKRIKSS